MPPDPEHTSPPESWEQIEQQLEALREGLRHSWRWYRDRYAALADRRDAQVDRRRLITLWQRARSRFLAEVEALNRRIDAHNREEPIRSRHWPRIAPDQEMRKLGIPDAPPDVPSRDEPSGPPESPPSGQPEPPITSMLHQIITLREKIPHTPRWEQARKRALWRYLARIQAKQREE